MPKSVVLVNPYPDYAKKVNAVTLLPPLGLGYIGSFLEKNGHECTIIDANAMKLKNETVAEQIKKLEPDIIGIHSNVVKAQSAIHLSNLLRSEGIPIVMGGPYPTSMPEYVLKQSGCNAVVIGEGEMTMLELVEKREWSGIDGIALPCDGRIVRNPPRPLIDDLDSLPFPAYHLFPAIKVYTTRARKKPVASIITSRGCPYGCIYCNKNIFGKRFRARSPENVIAEIEYLANEFGVKHFDIVDDNFTLDTDRAMRIADLIISKNLNVEIACHVGLRAESVTKELLVKLERAGVFQIGIGVESGDPKIQKLINKNLDLERVKKVAGWAREAGIKVNGFFMLGLPGETRESMQSTIDFALEMDPHIAQFHITIPFPGTALYDLIAAEGRFLVPTEGGFLSDYFNTDVLFEFGNLKKDDVSEYSKKAYRKFYIRPKKIFELITSPSSFTEMMWYLDAVIRYGKNTFL